LRLLVRRLKSPWLVTYDAVPEIVELYQGHKRVEYSISYSGREVMFFERSLSIPKLKSPTNISVEVVDQAKVRSFLGRSVNRTTRTAETTWNVPTHYR
jgi:DNA adenine methylase